METFTLSRKELHRPGLLKALCGGRLTNAQVAAGLAPVSWTPGLSGQCFVFPLLLERSGTEIAKRRMPSPPVVEGLEVIEELTARRGPRAPGRVVDELDLQRGEEALSDGVVPAVAPPAHAADDPVLRQHPLVVAAGVLPRSE